MGRRGRMSNIQQMMLEITGYLEALELDQETKQAIRELTFTYNEENLIICVEMLKTLSKSEKQRI